MRVLIVGAGIGGLTTALSLHRTGVHDVVVLEAAARIAPLGVGVNILPNATRVLDELGILEPLLAKATRTGELRYYNCRGDLIWREPRGLAAGYRWPQLSVHRVDLQAELLAAVRERLGERVVVTGALVTGVAVGEHGSSVEVEHADDGCVVVSGDVVIGADGIDSAVRAVLYPDEGAAPGNGVVMWRGTSWVPPFLDGTTMIVSGDDSRRIVLYPIRRADTGNVMVNWVCAQPAPDGVVPRSGRTGDLARFRESFDAWRMNWLDIPGIIAAADEMHEYPMLDRDPLPRWTFGRVTLLGDAAHAMYPMGSNGATQAIVDAHALAHALAGHDHVEDGLRAYEAERRPVTTRLQISNRGMGPESVITIAHQRAPHGFADISEVFTPDELAAISAQYARTGRFDVDSVNRVDVGRCS
ncbi:flavin-dependent oxidoreductase [Lentzea tibetensis]|uniref:Flavin-dependent oxidoreductase n=1 Tax=Lentzea tibetensis TaxID=2591470 RepID=A0A563F218_9PSEU|nr:flavin-dependent oxidoreductase [Lentzea tibetensis]TWP54017.1 flavin-dependent oxidoreductase [Lentzea tibetensis]